MWILPKNLETSSAFVADMVESSEDLSLPELKLEHSLMWKSKPTPLPTWLRKWKRETWVRHLFGRILKPSHHISFETKLKSSLEDIHVSPFRTPDNAQERMTLKGICGHTSENTSQQCDLFAAFSKTSKDTLLSDSEKSLMTWKALVTQRRSEFSARARLERATRESEYISWPTPAARDYKGANGYQATLDKIASGQRAQMGQLPNAVMIANKGSGHLNPEWVEWLMGVPRGHTELGSWAMESCPKQQREHGKS